MVSLEQVVWVVIYLLGAGLIFGLLFYLVRYVGGQFPEMQPFVKIANIILMVLAVLVLIGVILSFMGHPIIRLR